MASLCPKCLGELQPGARLCLSCGAEQGATRATGSDGAGESPLLPGVAPPPLSADPLARLLGPSSQPAPGIPLGDAPAAPLMVEAPVGTATPSAHTLIFGERPSPGPLPPSPFPNGPFPTGPSPFSPFGGGQGPGQPLRPAPVAMLRGDPRRRRLLAKLGRRSTLLPVAAVIVVVAVVASVLAIGGGSSKSASGTNPSGTRPAGHASKKPATLISRGPTVSIALRSPSDDPRPDVTVKVGNDPVPLHVVLDTGSVGLRVFSNLLPTGRGKGIDITSRSDSIEYVDGTQFSGPVADALVHIGNLATARTVPFQLVQNVTCDVQIPNCPASGGAAQFEADDVDGIMGIGLGGVYQNDPTTNPLLALAAPYRNSWSIQMSGGGANLPAPGTLVLGAHDPASPAAQFSLQQQGATVSGSPSWNDQFNLCWTVGGLSNCELTVFDSGSDLTVLSGSGFASVSTNAPGEVATLTTGTSVQCSQEIDGDPLWSFNAGGGTMQTVYVEPGGSDWVNSGVQAFYSFTVTYDEAHGEISLS